MVPWAVCLRSSVEVRCECTYRDDDVVAEGGTAMCTFKRALEKSCGMEGGWDEAAAAAGAFECLCLRFLCVEGGGVEDLRLLVVVVDMAVVKQRAW